MIACLALFFSLGGAGVASAMPPRLRMHDGKTAIRKAGRRWFGPRSRIGVKDCRRVHLREIICTLTETGWTMASPRFDPTAKGSLYNWHARRIGPDRVKVSSPNWRGAFIIRI